MFSTLDSPGQTSIFSVLCLCPCFLGAHKIPSRLPRDWFSLHKHAEGHFSDRPQLAFQSPGADLSPPAMVHFSKNTLHLWPCDYVMIFHVIKQRSPPAFPIDSEPCLGALAFPAFSRLYTMPALTYLCSSSICQLLS